MAQTTGRLDGRKILIVDDDPDVRESVEAAMRAEGARTMSCGDGNRAVDLSLNHKPELVVLDMMLPGRSGFLVLEKIKGYEDSPVVIMITANEGRRHRQYAQGLGADQYLQKPVSLEVLVETAAELLARDDAERGGRREAPVTRVGDEAPAETDDLEPDEDVDDEDDDASEPAVEAAEPRTRAAARSRKARPAEEPDQKSAPEPAADDAAEPDEVDEKPKRRATRRIKREA